MYMTVRPMLAVSQGKLWLLSTPFGKRGFFWDTWEHGGPEWERVRATAAECPRIHPEFLREELRAMGDRWFRQEYCCEFSDTTGTVFKSDLLDKALSDD